MITKEFKNNLESVFFLSDGLDSSSQSYSLKMPAMYASLPRSGAGLFFGSSPSINYGFSLQSTYNKCK